MKLIYKASVIVAVVGAIIACQETVNVKDLSPSAPTSLDLTGGSWKTIEAGDITGYAVPKPADVTDASYKAELQDLKTAQASLTDAQRGAVTYWAAGGVVRWNEIARELAANYNLPPVPNADGTYPVPSAATPTVAPKYPFANPPYAARAFAMLTVAQYDALVAAWYYKYKYKRAAPAKVDASILTSVAPSDLPAYPSEEAVIASASFQLLKVLFPAEVPALTLKYQEQVNACSWGGSNVKSDIAIGDSLGRWVALKILARLKTDGMATAGSVAALQGRIDIIKGTGEKTWVSLDSPVRPGMLANFGTVKPWNLGAGGVAAVRPGPPAAQNSDKFKQDIAELKSYANNLTREQFRIANYWADGPGSYTPPGHWNRIASDLIFKNNMNELRAARTLALMNTAVMDAGISCWDTKYYYMVPRPFQMDGEVKTVVGTPNFPAYTSGHSSFSGAAAIVLEYIFPEETATLEAKATEASVSRIYGCIHYRSDCEVGLTTGKKIGQFAIDRGKKDGSN